MIRWITPTLGTAAWDDAVSVVDIDLIDVRDLVDKGGNQPTDVRQKIDEAVAALTAGRRVLIACDYGISRSNAIAAGVLARLERMELDAALSKVLAKTGEPSIKLEMVEVVRRSLEAEDARAARQNAVLITGGRGFVGRKLAARLEPTSSVVAPSRDEVDLGDGSLSLNQLVRRHGVGTVVHLAFPRVVTSNASLGQATTAMKNLLDVCGEHRLRLVYLSGWEVFSGYTDSNPVCADVELQPRPASTYGYAKTICELLATQLADQRQFPLALLRSGPVFGSESDRPRFIRTFVAKALRNEPVVVHRYRNDLPRLDLMHVDDLVSAIVAVVDAKAEGVFHFGTGKLTSTTSVAERVVDRVRSSSRIAVRDIDSDICNVAMQTDKAQRELGWRVTIDPGDALDALIGNIAAEAGMNQATGTNGMER